jgi:hypothetical protein
MMNRILAISAVSAATLVKPSTPAMTDMIKNTNAHFSMTDSANMGRAIPVCDVTIAAVFTVWDDVGQFCRRALT